MSTILFIAPPGARGREELLFREIVSRSPDTDFSGVLYLGPNAPYLTAVRRAFFAYVKQQLGKPACIPFASLTIKQLALQLYQCGGQTDVVSDEVRTLILLQLIGDNNIGYATLLSELYSKIRHHLVESSLARVKDEISRLIFEDRARDRALASIAILEAYEAELIHKKLTDSEGVLREALVRISDHRKPSLLVLDGFLDPTPLEIEIIRAFIEHAVSTVIFAEEKSSLAGLAHDGMPCAVKRLKAATPRDARSYVLYPSMEEEVEGIVKSVKKLLMDGVRPWEITVSFPELSKYASMLARVSKKHGIPLSMTGHDRDVQQSGVVLLEFITCMEEDYPRNDFLSLLTSPFFGSIPDVVKEWAVSFSYRAGIIKGKEAWLSIDKTLTNEAQNLSEHEIQRIAEFQTGISDVIDVLENVRRQKGLASFIDAFEYALNTLGYAVPAGPGREAGNDVSARLNRTLSDARQFAAVCRSWQGPVAAPGFFLRYLLEGSGEREAELGGVRVVPFPLAASLEVKELFFGGMIEGDFPSKPGIDPILPERVKKELGLPYLEYYLARQRKYFNRLMNISERVPRFSCPAAEGDTLFLASPFLDWEQRQSPAAWKIYCDEEVLIREGALGYRGPEFRKVRSSGTGPDRTGGVLVHKKFRGYINVTDIDYYRKCPFRFYVENVLGLEIENPPRYEVEARLWGSLAHRTMEQLFRDGDIERGELEDALSRALESGLVQFPLGDFWSGVAREIFRRLLPGIRDLEAERTNQGYSPWMVEHKLNAEINGIKLKGKIDRVDVKRQGPGARTQGLTDSDATVILLDYKTGNIDRDSLQLPLYALLWKEKHAERIDKVGYYSLKEAGIRWYPVRTGMDEYLGSGLAAAEALVQKMRDGHFPAEPFSPAECRYCGHGPLCEGLR